MEDNEVRSEEDSTSKQLHPKPKTAKRLLIYQVAKTNQKKSGQGVSENYKSGWIYWDRLQFLIPVITAGKSKDWHKTS